MVESWCRARRGTVENRQDYTVEPWVVRRPGPRVRAARRQSDCASVGRRESVGPEAARASDQVLPLLREHERARKVLLGSPQETALVGHPRVLAEDGAQRAGREGRRVQSRCIECAEARRPRAVRLQEVQELAAAIVVSVVVARVEVSAHVVRMEAEGSRQAQLAEQAEQRVVDHARLRYPAAPGLVPT